MLIALGRLIRRPSTSRAYSGANSCSLTATGEAGSVSARSCGAHVNPPLPSVIVSSAHLFRKSACLSLSSRPWRIARTLRHLSKTRRVK